MQRLEVSGVVRPIYGSLGVKQLSKDWKEELNTQFVSSLDFEGQLKLLKLMVKLPICKGSKVYMLER